jgi:hypothetical protein
MEVVYIYMTISVVDFVASGWDNIFSIFFCILNSLLVLTVLIEVIVGRWSVCMGVGL